MGLLLACLLAATNLLGQNPDEQPILLFIDSNTIIGQIDAGMVYTGPGAAAYNLVGNTLYEGDIADRDKIVFLFGATELFPKRDAYVYFTNGQDVAYTWRKGILTLGKTGSQPDIERMLYAKPMGKDTYRIFAWENDAWLGTVVAPRAMRPAELLTTLHLFVLHYNLDHRVNDLLAASEQMFDSVPTGTLRPFLGSDPYREWIWDGKRLKPAWGIRVEDEWLFDGRYLKPAFGPTRDEWLWDGKVLKPAWDADPALQWAWESDFLRPFWNSTPDREFRKIDDRIKPAWSADPRFAWIMEGDIPLPIIALVVLGIADR